MTTDRIRTYQSLRLHRRFGVEVHYESGDEESATWFGNPFFRLRPAELRVIILILLGHRERL